MRHDNWHELILKTNNALKSPVVMFILMTDHHGKLLVVALLIIFTSVHGIDAYFFVVLLESGEVFASFGKLSLLPTLSDVPVDESALGVHQIELVVESTPSLSDGSGVAEHADGTLDLGEIATGNDSGWLVVDTDLETSWTPVDELDRTLGLDCCNCGVDILGDDITTVQETAGHVLALAGVALHHLVVGLEAGGCDFLYAELLVVSLLY